MEDEPRVEFGTWGSRKHLNLKKSLYKKDGIFQNYVVLGAIVWLKEIYDQIIYRSVVK